MDIWRSLVDSLQWLERSSLTRISDWLVNEGVSILFILLVGLLIQRIIKIVSGRIHHRVTRTHGGTASEKIARAETLTGVVTKTVSAIFWIITIIIVLDKLGFNVSPLITGAGIVGLAVGFGAQELVKDVISGFFFLLENQFNVGDRLQVKDKQGVVEDMNLRTVVLRGDDGSIHILRNSQIDIVSKIPATPSESPSAKALS